MQNKGSMVNILSSKSNEVPKILAHSYMEESKIVINLFGITNKRLLAEGTIGVGHRKRIVPLFKGTLAKSNWFLNETT